MFLSIAQLQCCPTQNLRKKRNKTCLQPVSRPVELVHYCEGWVEGASKQTDRTDGGWVQSTFGAKAEQINRQTDRTGRLKNLAKSDVYQRV